MADFGQFGDKFNITSFKFKGDELDPVSKYRVIPEGEYAFTVRDYKFGTTEKGDDKATLTLAVEYDDNEVYVSDTLTLKPSLLWKFGAFFSAIGMWEEVKATGVNEATWDKTIGKTGRFMNEHRVNGGKTYNQVKAYVKDLKPAVQ